MDHPSAAVKDILDLDFSIFIRNWSIRVTLLPSLTYVTNNCKTLHTIEWVEDSYFI